MSSEVDINEVYKQIKKQNGERFARILRDNGLLDIPDIVKTLMYAGDTEQNALDLVGYLRWIQAHKKDKQRFKETKLSPIELLDRAGYNAFVVHNKREKNSIKKYFAPNEELCTFRDPHRHENCYIIHAVKKDVDEIKRKYFTNPSRQDRYGTSVISIQIAKDGSRVSIKNRYNNTINNSDATFDNNPDNIIPGLTDALQKYFNISFKVPKVPVPGHVILYNNQLIHYDMEINNVHIGNGYYVNNDGIQHVNKDYEVQLDQFILNTKTSEIRDIAGKSDIEFINVFNKEISGTKITVKKDGKETVIFANGKEVARTEKGQLTSLTLTNCTELDNRFLFYNRTLKKLNAPNLKAMGGKCFYYAASLTELNLPELKDMRDYCFYHADSLTELNLPKLESMVNECFYYAASLTELNLPELKDMRDYCFYHANSLTKLNLPKLESMVNECFCHANSLTELNLPKLESMVNECFCYADSLTELNLPELKEMLYYCFYYANSLIELNLPELKEMRDYCFYYADSLTELNLPELKEMRGYCFYYANSLTKIDLPSVKNDGESVTRLNNLQKTLTFKFKSAISKVRKKMKQSFQQPLTSSRNNEDSRS